MKIDDPTEAEKLIADIIGDAKDFQDPLDGLVERTKSHPGAAFMPEVLERLAELKRDDRAAFEALRAQLKSAGCRMTALDEAMAEESGEAGSRGPSQADIHLERAQAAELFHSPDGTGFADLDINGHRETWPIRTKGFRRWLARRYFEATGGAPSSEALQSALNVIEAKAHFDAPERIVHVRVGGLGGRLYLDLADEKWRAVEIDANGWRVIENPPLRFRRASGMQPLPEPVRGGSIESLRDAVANGLKHLPHTRLEKLPRMADFAVWAAACETTFWPAGTFWAAYCGSRNEAVESVIEADPIAAGICTIMSTRTVWTQTATELLGALVKVAGERIVNSKTWPANARALTGRLRRAATFLRKTGIEIAFEREGKARTRIIRITNIPNHSAADVGGAEPSGTVRIVRPHAES